MTIGEGFFKDTTVDAPATEAGSAVVTGYGALLEEARSQFRWFDQNLKNHLCDPVDKNYYRGSRDAYGYVINMLEETIKQAI